MALDLTAIGREGETRERHWDSRDALLYAVGVGAGLGEPSDELAFTTENTTGVEQSVLPTFGVLLAQAPLGDLGDFDRSRLLHAEQAVRLHQPIPVAGTVRATARVTGIHDKGSGALVTSESTAVDASSGEPLVTSRSAVFIRGEGGFGGDRGPADDWSAPERPPDREPSYETRPEQALLYRLSGDRNPLHSDPAFAARGGFERPILHGLCVYGIAGRALLAHAAGGEVARFRGMSGRFSAPVLPGDGLRVRIWLPDVPEDQVVFQVLREDGTVVLDRGRAAIAPAR